MVDLLSENNIIFALRTLFFRLFVKKRFFPRSWDIFEIVPFLRLKKCCSIIWAYMTLKWSITGNAMIGQIVGLSLILFLVVFRPFLSMRGSCMRAQNLNFVVYTTYESLYCIPAFKMTRNPMVWSILSINQY